MAPPSPISALRAALLAFLVLLSPAAAWAQDSPDPQQQAATLYKQGKDAYAKGEFKAAAEHWERAHGLAPSPALLFNIARAYEQAGEFARAIEFYQRYLKDSPEAQDRAVVEATIKRLEQLVEAARPAPAKEPKAVEEEAAAHVKKGRELYNAGQYKEALLELQAAFDLVPSAAIIYNIAKTREKQGDVAGALRDYRTYLRMQPDAPDKGDVEYLIRNLEKKARGSLPELSLESNPAGAEVYLDGSTTLAGQTPLALRLAPGEHELKVQKNGYEVASRKFTMPDDRDLTLTFELRPLQNVGYLRVSCEQDGAHVFLDGTILALTPYKERRALTAGKHQVVLERAGYQRFVQVVDIKKGQESHLRVDLSSDESRARWPLLVGPLLGGTLFTVGLVGAVLSSTFALRASRSIENTPAWQQSIIGLAVGEAVAALLMLGGVLLAAGIVTLWVVVGFIGGGAGSEVTVTPVAEGGAP